MIPIKDNYEIAKYTYQKCTVKQFSDDNIYMFLVLVQILETYL